MTLLQPPSLLQIWPYHSCGTSYGIDLTKAMEPLADLTLPQPRSLLQIWPYHSRGASCGFDLTAATEPLAYSAAVYCGTSKVVTCIDLTTTWEPPANLTLPQPRSLLWIWPYCSRWASFRYDLTVAAEPLADLTLSQPRNLLWNWPYQSHGASCRFDLTAAAEPLTDLTLPQLGSLLRIQLLRTEAHLRLLLAHSDQQILQYKRILHFVFVF